MGIWKNLNKLFFYIVRPKVFFKCSKNYTVSKKLSSNKIAHCINGNIKMHGLKILHWNKVNSLFNNKIDDIKFILDKYSPHIFSISEAN